LLDAPPSVFDLKDGNNPTGATIPKGFRSVQVPVTSFKFDFEVLKLNIFYLIATSSA
jgi:hypothetical protein